MRISALFRLLTTILITAAGAWFFLLFLNWAAIQSRPGNHPLKLTDTATIQHMVIAAPLHKALPDTLYINPYPHHPSPDTPDAYVAKDSLHPVSASQPDDAPKNPTVNYAPFLFSLLIPFTLMAMMLVFYIFYRSLPFIDIDQTKDYDPPRLTSQFKKFGARIESLGNPRKIKRFSNKIRFQYYYLENKGLLTDQAFDQLFDILLLLETRPPAIHHAKVQQKVTPGAEGTFDQFLRTNQIQLEEPFKRVFYALNRESFY